MSLSPPRDSTFADLLRLAAGWLAVVLALQGLGAAQALARGPLHHHGAATPAHAHADARRHVHADAAAAASASPDGDWDAAAFALTAALALLALGGAVRWPGARGDVRRPGGPWVPGVAPTARLERPPRRG